MQKTEIKLFSDSNLTALESSVNRFLETLDKDDVVSVVVNKQRDDCKCLAKRQILGPMPRRCPHGCLYCFWQD